MPLYEYSYYVTLLHCNQFHWGGGTGDQSSHRGAVAPWPPLRTASGAVYLSLSECWMID